jgi:hypothetical protein
VKERPILFSGPMVRALLAGTKTQTRRAVKPQPTGGDVIFHPWNDGFAVGRFRDSENAVRQLPCPYGGYGTRLWVRESGWERPERTSKMMREGADTWAPYYYDADGEDAEQLREWGFKRRPSIHMPRWACRLTLEVVRIRAERVQEISAADVDAEGTSPLQLARGILRDDWKPQQAYARLWDSINGAGSWDANPWVWVVEFKVEPRP